MYEVLLRFRCNFYQEVNLLRQSNHENLVKLLAVCFDSTHPPSIQYLITEYLEWVGYLPNVKS